MLLFKVNEYAQAEERFVHDTLDALSRARGGVLAAIPREPSPRSDTTQVTTEEGNTVQFEPVEIRAPIRIDWDAIIAGRIEPLLASLDEAAAHHHEELSKFFFSNMDTLTAATGNQVDASGKSFFEYMYEMFEKVELSFEPDGRISRGFTFVVHPDTFEAMRKKEAEMTADERQRLDALIDRKREEYFARRRSRRLS